MSKVAIHPRVIKSGAAMDEEFVEELEAVKDPAENEFLWSRPCCVTSSFWAETFRVVKPEEPNATRWAASAPIPKV